MKKTLPTIAILALFICYYSSVFGQAAQTTPSGTLIANQNTNAVMPASAIFELRSTNKGMLPPRMTTTQINAISSPSMGLMVFDTDVKCLKTYNGSAWECANANIVASTPLSSSFAYQAIADNNAFAKAISADNAGNTISVGSFQGALTFGKGFSNMTLTSQGDYDGFISKHDADGNLIWATQIAGSSEHQITEIDIDAAGNFAVVGYLRGNTTFYSTNGSSSVFASNNNYSKIFVAKYNSLGVLQWFKVAGSAGNFDCVGNGVTFDVSGNVFFTGNYRGTVAFETQTLTSDTSTDDIFIAKLNGAGVYQWVKTSGGTSNIESGYRLVCDNSNSVYLYGWYSGTATFGENSNSITYTSRGGTDGFLAKYGTDGTLNWAKTFGSTSEHYFGGGLSYSSFNNSICIAGSFQGTLSFGTGLGTNMLSTVGFTGYYTGYLAKYDLNGNVQWATRMGNNNVYDSWYGPFHNYTTDVAFDNLGNPYIIGILRNNTYFYSHNSTASYFVKGVRVGEPFLAKYNANGALQWSITALDGNEETCYGLSVKNNIAYVFGNFKETINFGYQQLTSTNNSFNGNLFIWRYSE